jgi:hypothetical protein
VKVARAGAEDRFLAAAVLVQTKRLSCPVSRADRCCRAESRRFSSRYSYEWRFRPLREACAGPLIRPNDPLKPSSVVGELGDAGGGPLNDR